LVSIAVDRGFQRGDIHSARLASAVWHRSLGVPPRGKNWPRAADYSQLQRSTNAVLEGARGFGGKTIPISADAAKPFTAVARTHRI